MTEGILEKRRGMRSPEVLHWKGIVKKSKDSVFHVHGVEEHGGRVQVRDFEMKVTGVYGGDATKRQVAEV